MDTPRNRARAMRARFYHGKPCKLGHGTQRYVSTGHCVDCSVIQGARHYAANSEHMRATHLAWRKANAGKVNAKNRKSQLEHCTPPWADLKAIREIYETADRISKLTGVRHAVDHVIPIAGRQVSGLHVEGNLQILTLRDNVKKYNHFEG